MKQPLFILFLSYFVFISYGPIVSALTPSDDNLPVVQVSLLGDSLFFKPTHMWSLLNKIQDRVPGYNLNISVFARDSNFISMVRNNQLGPCLETRPQITLLLWDTDISNTYFDRMNAVQFQQFLGNYTENLVYVITQVIASGSYMAVGGPILLGEGWLIRELVWKSKNEPLDFFRNHNRDICNKLGVDYIDVRTAFLKRIPFFWSLFMGSMTIDGEHPNYSGAEMIATLFAQKIRNFLNSSPNTNFGPSHSAVN